ncbi:unnamed protein product [Notodromas monacha]|uniref:Fork-head domain-containing protein n=1 Tax=Notodromas monacha TaxID=399045 RepID=A0A7R9BEF4_9CRUS|nr:unnamed protein product [Notodromas monacha]CAG0913167.1 unnamed protein product [Notodromas monacha]
MDDNNNEEHNNNNNHHHNNKPGFVVVSVHHVRRGMLPMFDDADDDDEEEEHSHQGPSNVMRPPDLPMRAARFLQHDDEWNSEPSTPFSPHSEVTEAQRTNGPPPSLSYQEQETIFLQRLKKCIVVTSGNCGIGKKNYLQLGHVCELETLREKSVGSETTKVRTLPGLRSVDELLDPDEPGVLIASDSDDEPKPQVRHWLFGRKLRKEKNLQMSQSMGSEQLGTLMQHLHQEMRNPSAGEKQAHLLQQFLNQQQEKCSSDLLMRLQHQNLALQQFNDLQTQYLMLKPDRILEQDKLRNQTFLESLLDDKNCWRRMNPAGMMLSNHQQPQNGLQPGINRLQDPNGSSQDLAGLYAHGLCTWPGCETACEDKASLFKHLYSEHRLDDRSAAQARVQMQVVTQLETQAQREREKLNSMMAHLRTCAPGNPGYLPPEVTMVNHFEPTPSLRYKFASKEPYAYFHHQDTSGTKRVSSSTASPSEPKRMKADPDESMDAFQDLSRRKFETRPGNDLSAEILRNGDFYKANDVRPPYTYAALIREAIIQSPEKHLTLNAIYNWFQNTFSYFRKNTATWKNAVRHNLSLHKCFMRVENVKGAVWTVDEVEFCKRRPQRCSTGLGAHGQDESKALDLSHMEGSSNDSNITRSPTEYKNHSSYLVLNSDGSGHA